ncbi:hypothetical protein [Candidatus Hamiltonella defensa]|uniref:hypothetical protein n=1 Tax=Candidatus Williamhamiltonella defendens TaxID=138072 RepID=UPI0015816995|nr:hypothetical protein [Candidatus Hamiltonella defensa]
MAGHVSYLALWEFLRTLIRARLDVWGDLAQQTGGKSTQDTRGTIGVNIIFNDHRAELLR